MSRGPMPPQQQYAATLRVQRVEDSNMRNDYIFSNVCAVSPQDFPPDPQGRDHYILIQNQDRQEFVVIGRPTRGFPQGGISLSDPQRSWCSIGLRDQFYGQLYDPFGTGQPPYAGAVDVITSFASAREDKRTSQPFDEIALEKEARKVLNNQVLAPGQRVLLEIKNIPLLLVVQGVSLVNLGEDPASGKVFADPRVRGIVTQKTAIRFFKDPKDTIEINAAREEMSTQSIFQAGFTFEDLGIGGLGDEFQTILRRAFNSRMISIDQAKKLGIKHVRGMLLYGPPGTGKTLIARQIGKMLNTREPKVINGPQILNKYVGQSEENVRKMFEDAQKEYDEKGDKSGLHLIIFDELDAVCKQRGSGAGGGTGVGDSVVNQLLSILDGVKPLNNILLIGMTNRKDMIDEALLRPGRLEVQLEISLPDGPGRLEILHIHTKTMGVNGSLSEDVDLGVIAERTKNYSGAELSGIVNSATSFALSRHIEIGAQPKMKKEAGRIRLRQDDFLKAVDEVRPAYGVAEDELSRSIEWEIIRFNEHIREVLKACSISARTVETDETTKFASILLHGPPGAGKTALAAQIALDSQFPFVQMLGPENLVNQVSEQAKISYINNVFEKANRSPLGIVILDDLTRLIEWSKIGSIYSNKILQTLIGRIISKPAQGRRLLILATTSDFQTLQDLGVTDIFSKKLRIDPVRDRDEMGKILNAVQAFDPNTIQRVSRTLASNDPQGRLDLGVKHILQDFSEARAAARMKRQQSESREDGVNPQELAAQEARDRSEMFTKLMMDRMQ